MVFTVAYLKTLDPKQIDASADREIAFPLGPTNTGHMKGDDYLNQFRAAELLFPSHSRLCDPAPLRRGHRQTRLLGRNPHADDLTQARHKLYNQFLQVEHFIALPKPSPVYVLYQRTRPVVGLSLEIVYGNFPVMI
jgi:hypothetical protein